MYHKIPRIAPPPTINGKWDKDAWRSVPALCIDNPAGEKPEHLPETRARIAYDNKAIYVIFQVDDRFVRSVVTDYQGSVCRDSCVEFFFTPDMDTTVGYFNLEINCGGTALFTFRKSRDEGVNEVTPREFEEVTIAHSLPKIVDPEIIEPTTWTVEYSVPFSVLKEHCRMKAPQPGIKWRGNFYKCGDATSMPHWLSWAPLDCTHPDFHLPHCFGLLEFGA